MHAVLADSRRTWQTTVPVVLEVVTASLLSALLWQAFKRLTTLGQMEVSAGLNFSPGIVTILLALGLFFWNQKKFREYGVSLLDWPDNLKTGLVLGLMLIVIMFTDRFCFVHQAGNLRAPYGSAGSPFLVDAVVAAGFVTLFPWLFRLAQSTSRHLPTALVIVVMVALWIAPLAIAWSHHQPLIHLSLVVLGLITTTGFGEEFLYWGYILPRLNEVFGRPFSFGDIRFGWGLIVTSLLFGFIHTLNGVDILHGHFSLNWGWGLVVLFAGLWHGLLRERTGSILAGVALHGIGDTWVLVAIPFLLV